MARPEGYRKGSRLMRLADRFGLPVTTFVDTAGAYPGVDAEARGQAAANGTDPARSPAARSLPASPDLMRIFRIQRWEFWLSIVCFLGVAVFGTIPGIGIAIVIAVIEFLWNGWRPHSAMLGRAEGVKGYHDIVRYPDARQIPGLVLFRWDAPLFFANAELFKERVLDAAAQPPAPVRWLVVAAEPVTSVDVTAADTLAELDETLHAAGIEPSFAELKDPVKDKLKRFGVFAQLGGRFFFRLLALPSAAMLRATRWTGSIERTRARPEIVADPL
jgi:hypothetical protein